MRSHQISKALPPGVVDISENRSPLRWLVPGSLVALPYSDNLVTGGGPARELTAPRLKVQTHMEGLGLRVHEVEVAETWAVNLYFTIDGLFGKVGPSLTKNWKIKQVIGLLRQRPRIIGQQLETKIRTLDVPIAGE